MKEVKGSLWTKMDSLCLVIEDGEGRYRLVSLTKGYEGQLMTQVYETESEAVDDMTGYRKLDINISKVLREVLDVR